MEETVDQAVEAVEGEISDSNEQPENEQTPESVTEAEAQEEEEAEIDYEGDKYRVPPKLKDAFLRFQDYTQKTQEVAEQRKQTEQERAAFEQERQLAAQSYQRQQANLAAYSNLSALDRELEQYSKADWSSLSEQDPVEAQKLFFRYNQLKDERSQLAGFISTSEQQATQEHFASLAKMAEQGRQQVAKEVTKSAIELGLTEAELNQVYDPRHVKVLYYAKIGMEAMKKAKATTATPAQPLKTIKSSNSGNVRDPENMSTDEWVKWREKELRKK
jgi:hypothetical protein